MFNRANFAKAEREARQLLNEFGIDQPPINPVDLAEGLGVKVSFVEFGDEARNVSGFYDAEEDAIYVNKHEHPFRQTFTVAHELGHRILHKEWAHSNDYKVLLRDQDAPSGDAFEQEANCFAGHLLVPRHMLAHYQDMSTVAELSRLFCVSVPVIRIRLGRESKRAA